MNAGGDAALTAILMNAGLETRITAGWTPTRRVNTNFVESCGSLFWRGAQPFEWAVFA